MPRLSLVSLTCALALVTAGCDRQSSEEAQPEAAEAGSPAGKIDHGFAGQAMPAVALTDPSGAMLATADLKGTPVLLNLWATWCVPCVTEMPQLDTLAGELGDSVRIVTVSQDSKGAETVVPFFAQHKFAHLPQWLDPDNALGRLALNSGLPLTVLFDAKGKEVWRVAGGYDWSTAEAREMIAEASKT